MISPPDVTAVPLQDLGLVTVEILHEKEACDEPFTVAEILDVVGSHPQALMRVLGLQVATQTAMP
jgi:hypothetical protein